MNNPDGPVCNHERCKLNQFFHHSREAMFITERDGSFVDVNPAFEDLLGYSRSHLLTSQVSLVLANEDDRVDYQRSIETDGVVHDYPIALRHQDGTLLFGMIDAIVWRSNGRIAGYHGIIRTRAALMESFRSYLNRLKAEKHQVRQERRNLISDTQMLTRYLTDDLIEYIKKTGRNPLETSQQRVSVLFFDIRNSTGIAEKLSPDQFASFLSDILTDIMDLIYGCQGSVNKILGDGIMATFGVPLSTGTDSFHAVEAALHIRDYLKTFNDVRPDFLIQPVAAGIGIATGTVFAGVIGSVRRQEYTVLGDAVNIASRLESLTKQAGETILLDETTFQEVRETYACRPVLEGRLRGREEEVRIYGIR